MKKKRFYAWMLSGAIFIPGLLSCRTVEYVPVETIRNHSDTMILHTHRHDSVFVHDSVSMSVKNDTVMIEKYHNRIRYLTLRDTVCKTVTDSLAKEHPVIVEREKEVERKRSKPEWVLLISGVLLIIYIIYRTASAVRALWLSR